MRPVIGRARISSWAFWFKSPHSTTRQWREVKAHLSWTEEGKATGQRALSAYGRTSGGSLDRLYIYDFGEVLGPRFWDWSRNSSRMFSSHHPEAFPGSEWGPWLHRIRGKVFSNPQPSADLLKRLLNHPVKMGMSREVEICSLCGFYCILIPWKMLPWEGKVQVPCSVGQRFVPSTGWWWGVNSWGYGHGHSLQLCHSLPGPFL